MKIIFFIILFTFNAYATEQGVIWSKGHLYTLTTPKNWVLDNKVGKEMGLNAVFYPKGGSWNESESVMYTNITLKKQDNITLDIEKLVEHNKKNYKSRSIDVQVKNSEPIKLKGKHITIKQWELNNKSYETVAYIDKPKSIILIVLSSKSKKSSKESQAAFNELVSSFKFYSDKLEHKSLNNKEMNQLIKKAKKQEKTTAGEKYKNSVSKMLNSYIGQTLQFCGQKITKMNDIDAIFIINELGISYRAYWSKNKSSECLVNNGILDWAFPSPPIKDFHFHINIKMQ